MDKADIALLISGASVVCAGLSAFYARRMAKNDSERMKRKRLVFEVTVHPSRDYPGWSDVRVTVRNLEPVSATLNEVSVKRRGVKLLPYEAGFDSTVPYSPEKVDRLPLESASERFTVRSRIGPVDSRSDLPGQMPVVYLNFFAKGDAQPKDLVFDWEWSDGAER